MFSGSESIPGPLPLQERDIGSLAVDGDGVQGGEAGIHRSPIQCGLRQHPHSGLLTSQLCILCAVPETH